MKSIIAHISLIVLLSSGNMIAQDGKEGQFSVLDFNDLTSLFGVDTLEEMKVNCHQIEMCFEMCADYIDVHNSKLEPKINGIDNYLYLKDPNEYSLQLIFGKSKSGKEYAWINCVHISVLTDPPQQELLVIADGGFKNFNFWAELNSKSILK